MLSVALFNLHLLFLGKGALSVSFVRAQAHFTSFGRDVRETARWLSALSGAKGKKLPPIVVVAYKGRLWSRGNRRLKCYQMLLDPSSARHLFRMFFLGHAHVHVICDIVDEYLLWAHCQRQHCILSAKSHPVTSSLQQRCLSQHDSQARSLIVVSDNTKI